MVDRWLEVMVGPAIGSGKGCLPMQLEALACFNLLDPLVRFCRDAIGKIPELHRWLVASPQWFYILFNMFAVSYTCY